MMEKRTNIFLEYRKLGLKFWEFPIAPFVVVSLIAALFIIMLTLRGVLYEPITIISAFALLGALFLADIYSSIATMNRIVENNRIKMEFISLAYHQMRNPLTNLKWGLEMLEKKAGLEQDEGIKTLNQTTNNILKMVNDLLEASNTETNALAFKKDNISLTDITFGIVENYKKITEALHIELDFQPKSPLLPLVFADLEKTSMVIQNFIDNAIEYTNENGKIEINIILQDKHFLRFIIKDSGIGIPEKEQKYIFRKFFRAKNAKEKKSLGSGVGLFIAKTIVELQGGKIGFVSSEGKGSEFWFSLPLADKKVI